ncbi:hypothetical protein [Pseudoroseomonas ludipueritiae]|uniref:Uncharacterized protein n=1 Tax=Pseudoroseomonas ludipueritiae TaxID=198093 RepID=A0ABR7RC44_9PROT|nr:hypothetical protein [Pseudoroseomonas ludipueritiae]MBC9179142.1 hypothetical protein [Pseudoroseomonas ludipueritiae]
MTGGADGLAVTQERRMRAAAARRTTMLREEAARLRDEVTRLHAEIDRQRDYIKAQDVIILEDREKAARQVEGITSALLEMTVNRDQMANALRVTSMEHQRLLRSTTWRITAPLRWAVSHIPTSVRRLIRRGSR